MRIGLVRAFTRVADEDAVLHDDSSMPVLGKGLAVRTFQIVRELLELVERLLGAGLARHFFVVLFRLWRRRRGGAISACSQTIQCTARSVAP